MSQGFSPRRHKLDVEKAVRWARFRETGEKDFLPDHPGVLLLIIEALRRRLRRMIRTKKDQHLATIKNPPQIDIDDMQRVALVLLGRIEELDRTAKKELAWRIRLYIQAMTQRIRYPSEVEENWLYRSNLGHFDILFEDELEAIAQSKLVNFTCLPAVLRHQRDLLYDFMRRRAPDGYAKEDTPETWLKRNHKRLYQELTFYGCACTYRRDLEKLSKVVEVGTAPRRRHDKKKRIASLDSDSSWVTKEWPFPPRKVIFEDHHIELNDVMKSKGQGEMIPALLSVIHAISTSSIRQILKASSRRFKLPPFLQ